MSIRVRLILLVLAALAPALGAALWVITDTYARERQALERNLRDTTRAFALVLDRELAQRDAIVRVLALSRMLDAGPKISAEDLTLFEEQARRATAGLQGWVVLRSASGELMNTQPMSPGDAADVPSGTTTPASLADEAALTPLGPGNSGRSPSALLVQPVQRRGQTHLNLALAVLPAELQRICDDQRTPEGWITAVLDSQGTVVARHPGGAPYAGRPASADMMSQLRKGKDGFFDATSLDGTPTTAFFNTSSYGWSYVIAVPRSEFGNSLRRSVLQASLAGLAVLGLGVAAALWVSRGISGPMDALTRAARRLQRGDSVPHLAIGLRECDQVHAALSEAGDGILLARAELESQVAAAVSKTREAEQRAAHGRRIEALGRLTGGVAHDFNNLLGTISNSVHLMRHPRPGSDPSQPLAIVLRAVEAGSRLTQQLLRFSGRQTVRPEHMSLQQHLPELQPLLKTVVGSAVQLDVDVAPDTDAVHADAGELELSLINLALNARDAMPGGGRLQLHARNALGPELTHLGLSGPAVRISITDSGKGFEAHQLAHAFEPFFTTKPVGTGSGLGLSQVMGFCKQAGGTAQLTSTAGVGTTVLLWLPSDTGAASAVPQPPGAAVIPEETPRAPHLLLVEDNDPLAKVTEELLVLYGYQVTRAASGEKALQLLAEEPAAFDLALSDVVMPGGMDGFTLARQLRVLYPRLPMVLISGYAPGPSQAQDFEVLRKPCPPDELINALRRAAGQVVDA